MSNDARQVEVLEYAVPAPLDHRAAHRDGALLAIPLGAPLPQRCVHCNEPTDRVIVTTQHHYPSFGVVLSGTYPFIRVPLCVAHEARFRSRWRRATAIAVTGGVLLTSVIVLTLLDVTMPPRLALALIAVAAGMLFVGRLARRRALPIRLVEVEKRYLYFRGAGEPYLQSLG